MYKATAKDVKMLQQQGKDNEIIKEMIDNRKQPLLHVMAYYSPSSANWSWQIGIVKVGNIYYELLTRFGVVEGGRALYFIDYPLAYIQESN